MAMYKTYVTKPLEVERKWWIVDANGQTLGRLATRIATILRGKHKPIWAPNHDVGDFVVVINAEKLVVTGKKLDDKYYYDHSGYMGGMRETVLKDMLAKHPERVLERAVKGMLPDGSLGRNMLKKMKVYAGEQHPHAAQKPQTLEL